MDTGQGCELQQRLDATLIQLLLHRFSPLFGVTPTALGTGGLSTHTDGAFCPEPTEPSQTYSPQGRRRWSTSRLRKGAPFLWPVQSPASLLTLLTNCQSFIESKARQDRWGRQSDLHRVDPRISPCMWHFGQHRYRNCSETHQVCFHQSRKSHRPVATCG